MRLHDLDFFRAAGPTPSAYPANQRTLYAPLDNVHGALKVMLSSARQSLVVSMYGYDDPDLDAIIQAKLDDPRVFVQLNLDRSQAGGVHERAILGAWDDADLASSVAIGSSERGAISHLKMAVIDGRFVVTGSTNWSDGGESKQDNALVVIEDALVAAEARARLDRIHLVMRQQQERRAG
jgi:phosphatidylserine/phosphatidylglycerophosphate/cardiolipin synthase-like enzyme